MANEVDIRNNVTVYGQEECWWCGAASGQMMMNGYPDPADRIYFTQQDIFNSIQAHNSTVPTDVNQNWATDPQGLNQTLMDMNPPPGGSWVIHSNNDRARVLYDIMYWMRRNNYPVGTLINQGGHWVVIVGYISDLDPLVSNTPTLQEITKYDPEPHNVGNETTMAANVWFDTDWDGAVRYDGSWLNMYVAVIEPPKEKGRVMVKVINRVGPRIISEAIALKQATMWIDKLGLTKKATHAIMAKPGITTIKPLLVREEIKKQRKGHPHYYVIPYGFEREVGKTNTPMIRSCIIVNAHTGNFEEITTFGKPVQFLLEQEAVRIARRALGLNSDEAKKMELSLMYKPSDITHIRVYPFWKVQYKKRSIYIDQLGTVYSHIKISVPGD